MMKRIDRVIGWRGSFLLAFSVIDVVYAITLWTSDPDSVAVYRWFNAVVPLSIWGYVWMAVAVICAWLAFRPHHPPMRDEPGFHAAISIKIVWGLGSLFGWILGDVPPSSIVIWLGFAFVVWRIATLPEPLHTAHDLDHDA
jgi:hypothetical protein